MVRIQYQETGQRIGEGDIEGIIHTDLLKCGFFCLGLFMSQRGKSNNNKKQTNKKHLKFQLFSVL